MKALFYTLVLCILTSCGTFDVYVDPRLEDYVSAFEYEYGVFNTSDVIIGDVKALYPTWVGYCQKTQAKNIIMIDKQFYETWKYNYYAIQQVVFHELGHCVMYLTHETERFANGMPVSIMHPQNFGFMNYYREENEYYLDELGNR